MVIEVISQPQAVMLPTTARTSGEVNRPLPVIGIGSDVKPRPDSAAMQETTANTPVSSVENNHFSPSTDMASEQTAELQQALDTINELMQSTQRTLKFSVDDILNRVVVTVIDQATDEVVRQIPAEDVLDAARNLADMIAQDKDVTIQGLIFSEKV